MTIDKNYSQNIVNVDKSHKYKYTTNIPKMVFGFAASSDILPYM